MTLLRPRSDVPLPPAGRSVNESFSSHHHLEHRRLSVYSWWMMHPPVTLPQVNVQSAVLLQNYPAGHLILGIWLNFSFNYPVLCRAIEDSHKGPLLLMWAICFLSKMPTFPKPPTAPWASSHSFQGCVTLCKHTVKPQHAWRYSKCPFYSSWSSVINPDRNVWIFSSHVLSSLLLAVVYYCILIFIVRARTEERALHCEPSALMIISSFQPHCFILFGMICAKVEKVEPYRQNKISKAAIWA